MSSTFSMNIGSLESLKVLLRCGWSENVCQMRCTVVALIPDAFDIDRTLQWVASRGISSSVLCSTRSTSRSPMRSRSRLVQKAVEPVGKEPLAPFPHHLPRDPQLLRDIGVVLAF